MFNCPVVANYDVETNTIGAHDVELIQNKDGDYELINLTCPVGIVPESATWFWKTITDENNVSHEYLCTEILLWKRQPCYKTLKENGITRQSMEIKMLSCDLVDGKLCVYKFEFLAFCLLGTAEPCFESASIQLFSNTQFNSAYTEMMQDFKKTFSTIQQKDGDNVKDKIDLLQEYGVTIDQLGIDINKFSLEEIKTKILEFKNISDEQFKLESQFRSEIINILHSRKIETEHGLEIEYWFVDYDRENQEIYVIGAEDNKLYGLPFTVNGDTVTIDFTCKKRKKYEITDFVDGDPDTLTSFNQVVTEIFSIANDKYYTLESDFEDYKKNHSHSDEDFSILETYKKTKETEEQEEKAKNIFRKFASQLDNYPEFEMLKVNHDGLTINQIEDQCYMLAGKKSTKFSMNPSGSSDKLKLPFGVSNDSAPSDPYGGLFQKYGGTTK